jgi:hypothetical protein
MSHALVEKHSDLLKRETCGLRNLQVKGKATVSEAVSC